MTISEFWREIAYLCDKHGGSVSSGHRTPLHNSKVGGATNSQHLGFKAADIVLDKNSERHDLMRNAKLAGLWTLDETAIKNHVHIDDRYNT